MTFEEQKDEMIKKVVALKKDYDAFSRLVNTHHWRTTGHHYIDLSTMVEEISEFTEMSEEQKNDIHVQALLN